MILKGNRTLYILFSLSIVFFSFDNALSAQKNNPAGLNFIPKDITLKQDTASELKKRNYLTAEPDTNFTWEKYAAFLNKIADTSKYIVLPLNEFRQTFNSRKIVIGLRHDVDVDLNVAYQFSKVESRLGFRATYFILHSAAYYLVNPNNLAVRTDRIIPILQKMQNDNHFEIGWHNDLVTLQLIYNINPVMFLHNELNWLRSNGINIVGTASHGSNYCKVYHYLNYYFFEECTYPIVPNFDNNITVPIGGKNMPIIKGKLKDFDLMYEAYFLNNNKAFSDATVTNGIRWNIRMLDLDQLKPGDRAIILLHPVHWHKASVHSNIESFRLSGQISSSIDSVNSKISVKMPYGTNRGFLNAIYTLSPGAYAKVNGKMQVSRTTLNDFNNPLNYKVYSENRDIQKDWTINVYNAKNTECDILSFTIPNLTTSVLINASKKSVLVEVNEKADLRHLPVQFDLSPGATAWIDHSEKFSKTGVLNFSGSVHFRILAEDGIALSIWTVTVQKVKNPR